MITELKQGMLSNHSKQAICVGVPDCDKHPHHTYSTYLRAYR